MLASISEALTFSLFDPFQPSFHVLYSILPKDGPIIPILLSKVRTKRKECAHKSRDGKYLLLRTNRKRTIRGAHKTRDCCSAKISDFRYLGCTYAFWRAGWPKEAQLFAATLQKAIFRASYWHLATQENFRIATLLSLSEERKWLQISSLRIKKKCQNNFYSFQWLIIRA